MEIYELFMLALHHQTQVAEIIVSPHGRLLVLPLTDFLIRHSMNIKKS